MMSSRMPRRPVYAFVITGHGYGHSSRQMEVVRVLLTRHPDARAALLTATPEGIFRDHLGALPGVLARVDIVPYRADVGLVQIDGLVTDHAATLAALQAAWHDPARAEERLAGALAAAGASVVIADVPPVAFGAAERLGLPSVAVANFDWAFIYGHYARVDPRFAEWQWLCLEWQARAGVAVHLEPGPPLSGFRRVVEVGPIARTPLVGAAGVRARLGVPEGQRAVLASFGGFGLRDAERRLPPVDGVTWILAPPMAPIVRDDVRFATDVPYLALLAACDAVFTKPGYGMVCEAARNRTRVLHLDRGDFPEAPSLVAWLDAHLPAVHLADGDSMARALDELFALPDRWPERFDGAERVADVVDAAL